MANRIVFGRITLAACFVSAAVLCATSVMLTQEMPEQPSVIGTQDQIGASFAQTGRALSRGLADSVSPRQRSQMFGGALRVLLSVALLLCGWIAYAGNPGMAMPFWATSLPSALPRALSSSFQGDLVVTAQATWMPATWNAMPGEAAQIHGSTKLAEQNSEVARSDGRAGHTATADKLQAEAKSVQNGVRMRLSAARTHVGEWQLEEAEQDLRQAVVAAVWTASQKDLALPDVMRARLLKIESLTLLGQFLEANGRPTEALGSLRRAVEASAELVPSADSKMNEPLTADTIPVLARAEVALARALCAAGGQHGDAFQEAGRYLGLALQSVAHARVGQAAQEFAPLAAEIDAELASCSLQAGHLATADKQAKAALDIANGEVPVGPKKNLLSRKVAKLRAGVKHDEGLFKDALRYYDEYLAASSELSEKGSSDSFTSSPEFLVERLSVLQDKALAMAQDGRIDEGLASLDEVERLQQAMNDELLKKSGRQAKKFLAKTDVIDPKLWEEMARLSTTRAELLLARASTMETKLSAKARKQATKAVSMLRENGNYKKSLGNSLNTLGNVLSAIGRHTEADAAYKEALEVLSDVYGSDSPVVASIYDNLGLVAEARREPKEALRLFQFALGIQQRTLGISNPDTASSLSFIAANLEQHSTAKHAELVVAATRAVESAVQAYPEGHATRREAEERLTHLLKSDLTALLV